MDRLISQSDSFDDFLNRCRIQEIEAVCKPENKISLKFRAKGQQKFTRARTLGWCYLPENIMRQIELQNRYKAEFERIRAEKENSELSSFIGISKIIDISTEKMQDSPALEHWADIQNMKNASKIINILTELNIQSVGQLNGGMLAQRMLMGSMLPPMDEISRKIKELDEIIHLTEYYHEIKPEYKKYKAMKGFWKRRYEKKNLEKVENFRD